MAEEKNGVQQSTLPAACGRGSGVTGNKLFLDASLKQAWWKQGYLMSYADRLGITLKTNQNPSRYIKLLEMPNNSDAFVNRLTTNESVMSFFDGRPIDYSQLVPHIEIYKVYLTKDKKQAEIRFPFTAFTDFEEQAEAIKKRELFRGRDAGIQSIDLKMSGRGTNPISANIMHVTIKYFFNDIRTLFAPLALSPVEGSGVYVTYSDLIRYPPALNARKKEKKFAPSGAAFRIRLRLGWSVNPKNKHLQMAGGAGKEFIKAAENSKINFIGDMYTHNLEFNENGSITITAQYYGALESAFASTAADLLNRFNVNNDADIASVKETINTLENNFLETVSKSFTGGDKQNAFSDLVKLEQAYENLKKTRADINKIMKLGDKKTYPEEAKRKLIRDYTALVNATGKLASISADKFGGKFKNLQQIAKGKNIKRMMTAAHEKNVIKQTNTELSQMKKKALKRKGIAAAKKKLNKEIKKLRNEIKQIEKSAKAKHIFGYVIHLMDTNKVAWFSTEKNSAFETYSGYLQALEGGKTPGASKKARRKLTRARSRFEKTKTEIKEDKKEAASTKAKKGEKTKTSKSRSKVQMEAKLFKDTGAYKSGEKVMFFTLGDLVSAILEKGQFGRGIEEMAPDYRIIFGEYEFAPPTEENQVYRQSLYNLPISLEIFMNFISQKITGTGRSVYPLLHFIFDLTKFIMDKVMGTFGKVGTNIKAGHRPTTNFKLDLTALDLPKEYLKYKTDKHGTHLATIDLLKPKKATPGTTNASIDLSNFNVLQKLPSHRISNTFLFHAQRMDPHGQWVKHPHTGNRAQDRAQGIFHFFVGGPNRGILKNIKFVEVNDSKHSTALMRNAQAGGIASGEGLMKPSMYKVNVTLIGNPFFFIGQMFYVNTDLISGGHFREERLLNGGYYIVMDVQNSLGSEGWETKIEGILNVSDIAIKAYKDIPSDTIRPTRTMTPQKRKEITDKMNQAKLKGELESRAKTRRAYEKILAEDKAERTRAIDKKIKEYEKGQNP